MQIEAARGIILMILSAWVCVCTLLGHHLRVSGALTTNSDKNMPISFVMPACLSARPSLETAEQIFMEFGDEKFYWSMLKDGNFG